MSSTECTPTVYFEYSWAILSSISLINVLYSALVIGITTLSPISIVPMIVSGASAVANGLCYYSAYADYSRIHSVVAGAFADVMWLIQEAGLSFYSYQILTRVLFGRDRTIFLSCFWGMMVIILTIRIVILVSRVLGNLHSTGKYQDQVDHLHIGYFVSIAIVEIISAVFLLRTFLAAKKSSIAAFQKSSLFQHIVRSTEIRLASLSLIGITRAITYSSQTSAQSATSVSTQVDRFAYTLECMFPVVMMIDILSSKLFGSGYKHDRLSFFSTARRPTSGHVHTFPATNHASHFPGSRHSAYCANRARAFSNHSGAGQEPHAPFPSVMTTSKDFGRETSLAREWVERKIARDKDGINDSFKGENGIGIRRTVEFELCEYEHIQADEGD